MALSKREILMEAIVAKITAVTSPDQTYRVVTRDPISREHILKMNGGDAIVGVYDISETKEYLSSVTNCFLEVVIEFYYMPKIGQTKAAELNRIMAELIRTMRTDYTQGGNAIKTDEVSNNIDIDGIYDKIINGSIKFEVLYRHGVYSPFTSNC